MFLNPTMLAGLGGAVLPLVLHLLARARYRSVDWGAMMFLVPADARERQSSRLRQWALLGLRMAVVAALAMVLARPVFSSPFRPSPTSSAPLTVAIVLDCSASMSVAENGRTRLDLAKQAVLQILSGLRTTDLACLVPAGARNESAQSATPTSNHQSIAASLALPAPGFGGANLPNAMQQATDMLANSAPSGASDLYIICDRQASNWADLDSAFFDGLRRRLGPSGRVIVVPVGSTRDDNVVVDSVDLTGPGAAPIAATGFDSAAIRDVPTVFHARIQNYGSATRDAVPVTLSANGREILNTVINLPAKSSVSVFAPLTLSELGPAVLSARVGAPRESRHEVAIDVIEPVRVLLVGPVASEAPPPDDSQSSGSRNIAVSPGQISFLRAALTPHERVADQPPLSSAAPDPVHLTFVPASAFSAADLTSTDVVILSGIGILTATQAQALEQFAWAGGGILVTPGESTPDSSFDDLLPARLAPTTAPSTTLATPDATHGVFGFLSEWPSNSTVLVERAYSATPRPIDARILATFSDGRPFLIEGAIGRGRILLLTLPLDSRWSNLPQTPFFVPFIQSATTYLATSRLPNRNISLTPQSHADSAASPQVVAAGEGRGLRQRRRNPPLRTSPPAEIHSTSATFTLPADQSPDERLVTVTTPDGRQRPAEVRRPALGGPASIVIDTSLPGVYRFRYHIAGQERQSLFAVQPSRFESDLAPITDTQWSSFASTFDFDLATTSDSAIDSSAESPNGRAAPLASFFPRASSQDYWPILIPGVMALALFELFFSRHLASPRQAMTDLALHRGLRE